ncbi:MAG: hypothetical protein ACI4M9_00710 [Succinivibrio sp.]
MRELPKDVYRQSYLYKAGVRFDVNIVDTVCKKGLGLSFYLLSLLLVVLIFIYATGNLSVFHDISNFYILSFLVVIYLVFYIVRLVSYHQIRKRLRQDNAPVVVESYAVVLLDVGSLSRDRIISHPKKTAVIYKECGSLKPRFFLGPSQKADFTFRRDHLARVFLDRKDPKLYTIDDDKCYQTESKKLVEQEEFSTTVLETKLNRVGKCKTTSAQPQDL